MQQYIDIKVTECDLAIPRIWYLDTVDKSMVFFESILWVTISHTSESCVLSTSVYKNDTHISFLCL